MPRLAVSAQWRAATNASIPLINRSVSQKRNERRQNPEHLANDVARNGNVEVDHNESEQNDRDEQDDQFYQSDFEFLERAGRSAGALHFLGAANEFLVAVLALLATELAGGPFDDAT